MTAQHRGSVLAGEEIILRAFFTDAGGHAQTLDSIPDIYIYDGNVSSETIELEAIAKVYTEALAGPLTPTLLSAGYYTLTYVVPSGSAAGTFHDLWVGTINTTDDYELFSFSVTVGFNASDQSLGQNTMVIVELDNTISNVAGDSFLAGASLYYTTVYSPLYASPDLIRLEMGRWIDYIPDDTLALMAHISSKEANFINGASSQSWSNIQFARTRFVVFDTVWRCLMIPGQGRTASSGSGGIKQLGDLKIKDGSNDAAAIPDSILEYVMEQRREWWRVVNAGGNIVPGQGFAPAMAIKGTFDPDRRLNGRLWESPSDVNYPQPSTNRKSRQSGRRRGRFNFGRRNGR